MPTNRPASTAITPESIAAALAPRDGSAAPVGSSTSARTAAPSTASAPSDAVASYALGLGDDALILAQRLGEWIAHAPELEEDVALGNIALDLLGHARSFLTYAGSAWGATEDDLAYFRDEPAFRCRQLFEQPNGDFAQTIAKQLLASVYFDALYRALQHSNDEMLAAIAAKAAKEVDYHLDHSVQWLLRLGLGTEVSRVRMQRGLDAMWPFVDELFRPDPHAAGLDGIAVDPERLRAAFESQVPALIERAGLLVPTAPPARGGGRDGVHSEAFGALLAEMQVLARAHPGAIW